MNVDSHVLGLISQLYLGEDTDYINPFRQFRFYARAQHKVDNRRHCYTFLEASHVHANPYSAQVLNAELMREPNLDLSANILYKAERESSLPWEWRIQLVLTTESRYKLKFKKRLRPFVTLEGFFVVGSPFDEACVYLKQPRVQTKKLELNEIAEYNLNPSVNEIMRFLALSLLLLKRNNRRS